MNDNDEINRAQYSKFQPVASPELRFQKGETTRFHVEYYGDEFEEIDARTGRVVERGRIERPEYDYSDRRKAA